MQFTKVKKALFRWSTPTFVLWTDKMDKSIPRCCVQETDKINSSITIPYALESLQTRWTCPPLYFVF